MNLKNLVGIKVGHFIIKLRSLVNNEPKQGPTSQKESPSYPSTRFLPRISLINTNCFFSTGMPVRGTLSKNLKRAFLKTGHLLYGLFLLPECIFSSCLFHHFLLLATSRPWLAQVSNPKTSKRHNNKCFQFRRTGNYSLPWWQVVTKPGDKTLIQTGIKFSFHRCSFLANTNCKNDVKLENS